MPPYGVRFSPGRGTLFIVGEDSISSRPDKKILFPLLCQLPYPLFFAGRRRKEKLTKETPRGDAPKETF